MTMSTKKLSECIRILDSCYENNYAPVRFHDYDFSVEFDNTGGVSVYYKPCSDENNWNLYGYLSEKIVFDWRRGML